MCPFPLLSLV
jgi:hypothetical protein